MKLEIKPEEEIESTYNFVKKMIKGINFDKEKFFELLDITGDFMKKMGEFNGKYRVKKYVLKDKPFRWGGLNHNFDKTAKERREENIKFHGKDDVYNECFCCHKEPPQDEPLYCATFEETTSPYQAKYGFNILCRKCAYSYGVGVIEKGGKTYMKYEDFEKEEQEKCLNKKN